MIELVEDRLDIDTYLELRQSVQFRELTLRSGRKKDLVTVCIHWLHLKMERQLAWDES